MSKIKRIATTLIVILSSISLFMSQFSKESDHISGQFRVIEKMDGAIVVKEVSLIGGKKYKVRVESKDLWVSLEVPKRYHMNISKTEKGEYRLDKIIGFPRL